MDIKENKLTKNYIEENKKYCEHCEGYEVGDCGLFIYGLDHIIPEITHCPYCGRKLKE